MILHEESVPAVVVDHEVLPFVDNFPQVLKMPFARAKLSAVAIIDTDAVDTGISDKPPPQIQCKTVLGEYGTLHIKLENHIQLSPVPPNRPQHLIRIIHPWHLSHCECIILI